MSLQVQYKDAQAGDVLSVDTELGSVKLHIEGPLRVEPSDRLSVEVLGATAFVEPKGVRFKGFQHVVPYGDRVTITRQFDEPQYLGAVVRLDQADSLSDDEVFAVRVRSSNVSVDAWSITDNPGDLRAWAWLKDSVVAVVNSGVPVKSESQPDDWW